MNTLLNLGLDVGMGALKLVSTAGGSQTLAHVAVNGAARIAPMTGLSTRKPPLSILHAGHSFYVDAGAHDHGRPIEALDFERLNGTPEMRALFCGALTRHMQAYGPFTAPLRVMVGLPIEMLTGESAQTHTNAIQQWLKGTHTWSADGHPQQIEIAEVKVTSQAAGALFDYLLDETAQLVPERKAHFKKEIGIVSIGFNTLELLLVREKAPVQRFTTGATVGVRRLLELVNPERLYSFGELDTRLRAKQLDVSAALPVWEREIVGVIEQCWGKAWRRFAVILVVGGGALLLQNTLPLRFNGKAIIPTDPVLAIARGLFKLACWTHRKGN